MKVLLSNCGNPDYGQHPDRPIYGTPGRKFEKVNSFKEASEKCLEYIKKYDLGGGNWIGGAIKDDSGKTIAYVSYNGRVLEGPEFALNAKEIKI